MKQLFNPGNAAFRFLEILCDLMILNLLFLITSIPIITIGASLTSLYSVTLKSVRHDDCPVVKTYFYSFKENFKQSTLIWLIQLVFLLFIFSDLYVIFNVIDNSYLALQVPVFILLFLVLSVIVYAFPLLSTYETNVKHLIKNSILLSLCNVPTTIFIIAFPVLIIYLCGHSNAALIFFFSLLLFFGIAFLAYLYSFFLQRIFDNISTKHIQS